MSDRRGMLEALSPQAGRPVHLSLSCSLAPGRAWPAASAALARVLGSAPAPSVVILDLAMTELDFEAGAALGWLRDGLRPAGCRLWLAASSKAARQQLQEAGVRELLGPDAVHHSLRAAVLAVYAARPGPGLVTPDLRAALTIPPEPLPAEGAVAPAAEPLPVGRVQPVGRAQPAVRAQPPARRARLPVGRGRLAARRFRPRIASPAAALRPALSAREASPPAGGAAPGR